MTEASFEHSETAPISAFARYLAAKTSVDDRALNKDVVLALRSELAARSCERPSVLEIGGGLGTMLARLLDWKVLERADYQLLEREPALLGRAQAWLGAWAQQRGFSSESGASVLTIRGPGVDVGVRFVCRDVSDVRAPVASGSFDLLIANAVLDVLDVPSTLPGLFAELARGGLFWLTLNFDGDTVFLPELAGDSALLRVYHRSMDERVLGGRPSGDSKTGRHLFQHIPAAGGRILAAGASDWVVRADAGRYPNDERYFLEHILDIVNAELQTHADVDRSALAGWLGERRAQTDAGELVYLARQLDFLGVRAG